jgi:hypothetical protein
MKRGPISEREKKRGTRNLRDLVFRILSSCCGTIDKNNECETETAGFSLGLKKRRKPTNPSVPLQYGGILILLFF